ncbi:hypothetical protein WA158_000649 [Blastocystis sp. Blastoise]
MSEMEYSGDTCPKSCPGRKCPCLCCSIHSSMSPADRQKMMQKMCLDDPKAVKERYLSENPDAEIVPNIFVKQYDQEQNLSDRSAKEILLFKLLTGQQDILNS